MSGRTTAEVYAIARNVFTAEELLAMLDQRTLAASMAQQINTRLYRNGSRTRVTPDEARMLLNPDFRVVIEADGESIEENFRRVGRHLVKGARQ